jgi:pimeloyl-ACP methyl ester carboxylesterase
MAEPAARSSLLCLGFTDLVDSTALKSRLGDAAAGERIARYHAQVRRLVADTGGREIDCAGDGFPASALQDSDTMMTMVNGVRRMTIPVLMLNGRYDIDFPLETHQVPFFELLGTPPADKRHVVFDAGHWGPKPAELVKETLDWLDRYLGPPPG